MPIPLTDMFDETAEKGFRKTPDGMAHWAGTGPKGRSCRECIHYDADKRYRTGMLRPGRCKKYGAMMRRKGPTFPHETQACKHFEANPAPPPIKKLKG